MKKFSFSLDKVLDYKLQIVEHLQGEHAAILAEIKSQEEAIVSLQHKYDKCNEDLKEEQRIGITVNQIFTYENYMEVLSFQIKKEKEKLQLLHKKAEIKRQQVVEARKESSSIEKLKEKKLEGYRKEVQKQEEQLIEEFVMNEKSKDLVG